MGNAATAVGDTLTCFRNHENRDAVQSGASKLGVGRDLDDAVLAATNKSIQNQGGLVNIVSLSFACENLPNLDTFTRTDGMVVLYQKAGNFWNKLGQTEVIMDSLEPKWVKSFDVQYHFEKREQYKVDVYDIDDFNNLDNYTGHDKVGSLEFALHEVVTARDQTLIKDLECSERPVGRSGKIKITGDEKQGLNNEELNFKVQGQFTSNQGMNFFLIHKFISPQVYKPIYKSEIKPAVNGAFTFANVSLLTSELANEDPEREIRIEFFKSSKAGKHTNLGYITFNLAQLRENTTEFFLHGRNGRPGTQKVNILSPQFNKRHTFLEYVFGGCEIQLGIAIDFTLSNGRPSEPDSLHYLNFQKNEYLNAIKSVGNILQYYDSDKQIPTFGFGAQVPPTTNRASHCFALNGDIFDPEVDGLDGVVQAYQNALKNVNLYGPTNFAEIIRLMNDMAEAEKVTAVHQKYFILLIITDGIINDMQKTIDEIVRGSALPMSIIIVGVGSDDFENMDILDADETPLYSTRFKKYMEADIVQFVPFRDFKDNPILLAKETLEEVPGQMLNYFKKRNIFPLPANEEEKKKIMKKLSMQKSFGGQRDKDVPEFFDQKKEKFLEKMTDMGMDLMEVKDFIEDRGMYEENAELIIDHLNSQTFVNPLKAGFLQQNPAQQRVGMQPQQMQGYPQQPPHAVNQRYPQQPGQPQGYEYVENTNLLPPISGGINKANLSTWNQAPMGQQPVHPQHQQPQLIQAKQSYDTESCKVCLNKKISTVMIPCGHRCVCQDCAKVCNKECPICRQAVTQIVNTYDV